MEKEITQIKDKFSDMILEFTEKSSNRYYILIDKKHLLYVIRYLFEDLKARYMIESGIDMEDGIEILYHFALDRKGIVISIRTILSRDEPVVESISSIVTGAKWIEREIMDILGVKFLNHPNPQRFILSDDWCDRDYPLRRDYQPSPPDAEPQS